LPKTCALHCEPLILLSMYANNLLSGETLKYFQSNFLYTSYLIFPLSPSFYFGIFSSFSPPYFIIPSPLHHLPFFYIFLQFKFTYVSQLSCFLFSLIFYLLRLYLLLFQHTLIFMLLVLFLILASLFSPPPLILFFLTSLLLHSSYLLLQWCDAHGCSRRRWLSSLLLNEVIFSYYLGKTRRKDNVNWVWQSIYTGCPEIVSWGHDHEVSSMLRDKISTDSAFRARIEILSRFTAIIMDFI
jgi:hypothetical protein